MPWPSHWRSPSASCSDSGCRHPTFNTRPTFAPTRAVRPTRSGRRAETGHRARRSTNAAPVPRRSEAMSTTRLAVDSWRTTPSLRRDCAASGSRIRRLLLDVEIALHAAEHDFGEPAFHVMRTAWLDNSMSSLLRDSTSTKLRASSALQCVARPRRGRLGFRSPRLARHHSRSIRRPEPCPCSRAACPKFRAVERVTGRRFTVSLVRSSHERGFVPVALRSRGCSLAGVFR
jgi:hypothetical protein